ncbi:MAG: hypothetical protein LBU73_04875 [Helicobacteraceae bacterium]|jgi:phage protein D|nr:hypothetical protein [Helicobacteraceae bacterium]
MVTLKINGAIKELGSLTALVFTDNDGEESDELSLTFCGLWKRPAYGDAIDLWIKGNFMGKFVVQTSERSNNNELSVTASGANFATLKTKRDFAYENTTLKDIAAIVAARHGLQVKSDADISLPYIAQQNESDSAFMARAAKDYDLLFSVKNATLLLLKRDKETLPHYTINVSECSAIRIKHTDRPQYKSALGIWHDETTNETKQITIGSGDPQLRVERRFKDEEQAKAKTEAALKVALRGAVSGSLTCAGAPIYAGGVLNLKGSAEDDGEYSIKQVRHDVGSGGWTCEAQFEN